jgi:GNAT superfamily N-acetyltransferase
MREINEQDIIAPLLAHSPFARFYRQQRNKIKADVAWFIDPELPSPGMNRTTGTGGVQIMLKWMPATYDDAFTVAHELTHSLLDQEGWPSLGACLSATQDEQNIAGALNTILDFEVDPRLRSVGFSRELMATLETFAESLTAVGLGPRYVPRIIELARQTGWDTPQKVRKFYRLVVAGLTPNDGFCIDEGRR